MLALHSIVRAAWATLDLPQVAHPCVGLSVGVTSLLADGWATCGKVFVGYQLQALLEFAEKLLFSRSSDSKIRSWFGCIMLLTIVRARGL